jgi:molybdate transport system ATP-binding protein
MINLQNVTVIKSGVPLLRNFSWRIQAGEHWLIAGTNGSGKTVLLELLAGVIHATAGLVEYTFIRGADWDERYAQRRQHILYIPAHAIPVLLKGHHELFYQQRYYAMGDERIARVQDLFGERLDNLKSMSLPETFSIDRLLSLEITRLSNGQLKKVLILRSLVQGIPKFLLLDYPFEGLDYASREDLAAFLDHLAHQYGIQLVVADHDHHLPSVIRKKLTLHNLAIRHEEDIAPMAVEKPIPAGTSVQNKSADVIAELRDVTIQYGAHTVISNFHWRIARGERWALTGRNGSGKTTLFSLIFADHPLAYREKVFLFGKRRGTGESIWDIKKRIHYIGPELIHFLDPSHITQTGVAFIQHQNKAASAQAIADMLHHFDAAAVLNKPVKNLSSGQLQLMLIISVFLSRKELLLLDEPFQFLDKTQKDRVSNYMQQHLQRDTTLVLITHYEHDLKKWTSLRMSLDK